MITKEKFIEIYLRFEKLQDVADQLKVSKVTVFNYAKKWELPAKKNGRPRKIK